MAAFIEWLVNIWESVVPWVILQPWEVGIRVRFGKWVKELHPGLHFTIPVLDYIDTINKEKQWEAVEEQTVETVDHVSMLFVSSINYEIRNPLKLWLNVQDHDDSLAEQCAVILAKWVNSHHYDEITIVKIEQECYPLVREKGFQWGCEVRELGIKTLSKHRAYRIMMG